MAPSMLWCCEMQFADTTGVTCLFLRPQAQPDHIQTCLEPHFLDRHRPILLLVPVLDPPSVPYTQGSFRQH